MADRTVQTKVAGGGASSPESRSLIRIAADGSGNPLNRVPPRADDLRKTLCRPGDSPLPLRSLVPDPNPRSRSLSLRGRGHSPAAAELAGWCGDAARLLHLARRLGPDGVEVCALRGRLLADLVILVQDHAPFELEVTPRAIVFADEPVFMADDENPPGGPPSLEYELSWVLHRDGIRMLRFERGVDE